MPDSPPRSVDRARLRSAILVVLLSVAALAVLRTAFEPRFDSVRAVEADLGEDAVFATNASGTNEVRLAVPPATDRVGGAAAALATSPRIVLREDGRYGFRVAPTSGVGNDLLAPGAALAESAIATLHARIDRQAKEFAARLASLGEHEVVFLDSRSRRIPIAMTAIPDLRRVDGPGLLMESLRRTLERLGAGAAPPPDSEPDAPASSGPVDSRAEAIARSARERASAWAADDVSAAAGRAELAAFADRVAAFAMEIAPGGPETRRILAAAARDALARFVQHAGPASVSPPVRMASLFLLGTIGGALVAALRSGAAAGMARAALGGALFSVFGVLVLESNGILPTVAQAPLDRWLRGAEIAAIALGGIGGYVLDGRIVAREAATPASTSTGG